jgi:hypothetical protein
MATYEELKSELIVIAGVLEKLPDSVRPRAFDLLVSALAGNEPQQNHARELPRLSRDRNGAERSTKKPTGKESYSIDRNLDLHGAGNVPSFKAFAAEKNPGSNQEFNAVAVYYLMRLLKKPSATLDHVYTCYAEVKRKPAGHFKQNLIDTKNKLGYVEFDDQGNLLIPHRGVVFVEHDLPREAKKAK